MPDASTMPLRYTIGLHTEVGQKRSHNEDTAAIIDLPGTQASFILCDGMGGLRAGDVASSEAVRSIAQTLQKRFAASEYRASRCVRAATPSPCPVCGLLRLWPAALLIRTRHGCCDTGRAPGVCCPKLAARTNASCLVTRKAERCKPSAVESLACCFALGEPCTEEAIDAVIFSQMTR